MSCVQKHFWGAWGVCVLLLCACGGDKNKIPPEPVHHVYLTAPDPYVVGGAVPVIVRVQGCTKVLQAQVFQEDTPIADIRFDEKNTAQLSLPAKTFESFYPELGFAAQLKLKARVKCEDGHSKDSLPQSIFFMPVESVVEPETGMAATDTFAATGGTSSLPTTFFGCAADFQNSQPFFLAHFKPNGESIGQIPMGNTEFQCNAHTKISAPAPAPHNNTRWAYTAGDTKDKQKNLCTLFAFRDKPSFEAVDKTGFKSYDFESCKGFVMDAQGNAYVVVEDSQGFRLTRIAVAGGDEARNDSGKLSFPVIQFFAFPGYPVVSGQNLFLLLWTRVGTGLNGMLEVVRFDISGTVTDIHRNWPVPLCNPNGISGSLEKCPSIPLSFSRGPTTPVPAAILSANASRLYLAKGTSPNDYFVDVYNVSNLSQPLASWGPIESPITKLSLSRDESFLVASTNQRAHFLSTTPSGNKLPELGEPLSISGTLYITGHVHGPGNSLILLGTPFFEEPGQYGWPLEAIAVDSPRQGELWRFNYGEEGKEPPQAIAVAFDDGGQMWMRAGAKLIKLLPQTEYRKARTPKR